MRSEILFSEEVAFDALGRITGVVNELGSFTTSTAAQKRAAADGTVLVNYYGSGEKHGTDSLVYLSDHLGSARAWYRVSDGEVGTAEYGAFGQRQLLAAGPGEPERGYTGHLRHAASGLVLAPYRAYDPQLGRWLSEDPIMEAGGLNLYGYVGNGPVMLIDNLGLAYAIFDRFDNKITIISENTDEVAYYDASNNTIRPSGDPFVVGSNGPAPNGLWPIKLRPGRPSNSVSYGPAFFAIGAEGPNGERIDIARQRGIGLHGGRKSHESKTEGCIRMNNKDILNLIDRLNWWGETLDYILIQ